MAHSNQAGHQLRGKGTISITPGTNRVRLREAEHVLRCMKGTVNYVLTLFPHYTAPMHSAAELEVQVDSDWAGDVTTRKSTSGAVIKLWGCAVHHYSRTHNTVATSSGEAELYAIGSGVSEALAMLHCLKELNYFKHICLKVLTDSTTAKSITTRFWPRQAEQTHCTTFPVRTGPRALGTSSLQDNLHYRQLL